MTDFKNGNILTTIRIVSEASNNRGVDEDWSGDLAEGLYILANYFSVTMIQAYILVNIFALSYKRTEVDLDDLARYLDCSSLTLLGLNSDFEALFERKLLIKTRNRRRRRISYKDTGFEVSEEVSKAIIHNEPLPEIKAIADYTLYEFLEEIHELVEERDDGEVSYGEMQDKAEQLIRDCKHLPFLKKITMLNLEFTELISFLYLCRAATAGALAVNVEMIASKVTLSYHGRLAFVRKTYDKKLLLFKYNLVTLEKAQFKHDLDFVLTEPVLKEILGEDASFLFNKEQEKAANIVDCNAIVPKALFYNQKDVAQIGFLKDSLGKRNFKNLQKRLEEKRLPKGVNVLFYGHPGTGKTETVLQLAKQTGRDVFKVEISDSKSKWFGESEKQIKRIFTQYKRACEQSKHTPILLFNEADAVLSKRKTVGSSNVDQTENAMQNILLEEMEKMEGILIATTNLTQNLDSAFDRRFLHKIEFHKPDEEAMQKIWRNKLPGYKKHEYEVLAENFHLSGGQIENVVRKTTMQEVLYNTKADLHTLCNYCLEEGEYREEKKKKVGF